LSEEDLERREIELFRRLKDDFPFYAPRALRIRTKAGRIEPFRLNSAQQVLHDAIERQRGEAGRVRVLCLKGRQQGVSTYVQGRFFWRVTHGRGLRAFILTHQDSATNNLFGMAERFHENCPPDLKPVLGASNAKELDFKVLDSGYKVGTAGNKGVGRSDTIQLFHGSEAAFWPNAEEHVMGALQAVPDVDETEVMLESTSNGPSGVFYDRCMAALRGETDFRLVFIPWFLQPEYRRKVAEGFELTGEEAEYAATHGLGLDQMAWRRAKVRELGGLHNFRREYPATPEEAFRVEAPGALWKRDQLDACRVSGHPDLVRIVVAIDPSGGKNGDEVGIVVAGLGVDGNGYVLWDASGKMTPNEWGRRAVGLYQVHRADRIVGERNFGGDMVEATIRTVDKTVAYKDVVASRGKQQRAEPVQALYEQGRVKHLGMLAALEDQMCAWQPWISQFSPGKLDALVWAITDLLLPEGAGSYDTSMSWVTGVRPSGLAQFPAAS
jgi:Terminase RNaseH-like domain